MSAACRQISLPARLPTQQDADGGLATNAAGLCGVFDTIMESPDRPLNPRAAATLSGGGRLVQRTESLPAVSPLRGNGFDVDLHGASLQRTAVLPARTPRPLCWQAVTCLHSTLAGLLGVDQRHGTGPRPFGGDGSVWYLRRGCGTATCAEGDGSAGRHKGCQLSTAKCRANATLQSSACSRRRKR